MADKTFIEWTNATWNIVTGCTLVSEGCTNCYAAQLAATRLKHHSSREGLARLNAAGVAKFTGEVRFNEQWLDQPLRWKRPRMIFVCAHGDLFHENVPDDWIDKVFAVMALAPQHTFQVLTKRPERMREYMSLQRSIDGVADRMRRIGTPASSVGEAFFNVTGHKMDPFHTWWPLPNVWLGTSVENQKTADARIPDLLATPAAIRWISAEPLLGQLSLVSDLGGTLWIGGQRGCGGTHRHSGKAGEVIHGDKHAASPQIQHHHHDNRCRRGLDWVVLGGESGRNARPMHPDWARDIRDQCKSASVPFLFKQWGEWFPFGEIDAHGRINTVSKGKRNGEWHEWTDGEISVRLGKAIAGRTLDGTIHDAFPTGETSHGR